MQFIYKQFKNYLFDLIQLLVLMYNQITIIKIRILSSGKTMKIKKSSNLLERHEK